MHYTRLNKQWGKLKKTHPGQKQKTKHETFNILLSFAAASNETFF